MRQLKFFKNSFIDLSILLLRLGFGGMILLHGIGKLSDLAGGNTGLPDPVGIGSRLSLALVTIAEFGCAILLIAGLFTRLSLLPLISTMIIVVLIEEGHLEIGDKEPPVLYLIAFTGLFFSGPGRFSLDHVFFKRSGKDY